MNTNRKPCTCYCHLVPIERFSGRNTCNKCTYEIRHNKKYNKDIFSTYQVDRIQQSYKVIDSKRILDVSHIPLEIKLSSNDEIFVRLTDLNIMPGSLTMAI